MGVGGSEQGHEGWLFARGWRTERADAGIVMKLLSQLEIKGYLSRCGGTLRD